MLLISPTSRAVNPAPISGSAALQCWSVMKDKLGELSHYRCTALIRSLDQEAIKTEKPIEHGLLIRQHTVRYLRYSLQETRQSNPRLSHVCGSIFLAELGHVCKTCCNMRVSCV